MDCYEIHEVDGELNADLLCSMNALAPEIFPPLTSDHLANGFWWIAYFKDEPVAFAGMVEFHPFPRVGYFKRSLVVSPDHYGHGLQYRMIWSSIVKARQLKWDMLVADCGPNNHYSASNLRKEFEIINPEQKWAGADDLYWRKVLA